MSLWNGLQLGPRCAGSAAGTACRKPQHKRGDGATGVAAGAAVPAGASTAVTVQPCTSGLSLFTRVQGAAPPGFPLASAWGGRLVGQTTAPSLQLVSEP